MVETLLCPQTGRAMTRAVRPFTVSYKGRSRTVEMPGWYCDASGEGVFTREDMRVSDLALVTLKAEASNLVTPEEVKRVRTSLGLSQAEAGRLFGGGVRAFQKYESGEVLASRAMTNLLRMLARHPTDVEWIRADLREAEVERECA